MDTARPTYDVGDVHNGSSGVNEQVFLGNSTTPTTVNVLQAKDFRMAQVGYTIYLGFGSDLHMYQFDNNYSGTISPDSNNMFNANYEVHNLPAHILATQVDGVNEDPNYIYIERNIYASSVTGVFNDYDPNGDGWAIVGQSKGKLYSDTSVPDTRPIANFKVVSTGTSTTPYLFIRAGGYGCVEYTPVSLAQVTNPGSLRAMKIVAENTNQCRQEDASADINNNGQSDNAEPIYGTCW